MASQAQRQYQTEERATTAQRGGWSQAMNRNLNFMEDSATEEIPMPTQASPRIVRNNAQTGSLRQPTGPLPQPIGRPASHPASNLSERVQAVLAGLGSAKPAVLLCAAAVSLLLAYVLISSAVSAVSTKLDDLSYGEFRTEQKDVVVGHNDSAANPTHLMGINLHGQLVVVEFPGGDATKAMTINGPYLFGQGEDKTPVHLDTVDLNGDGKLDLLVSAKGAQTAYLNDGNAFRAMKPEERAQLEKQLTAPAAPASNLSTK